MNCSTPDSLTFTISWSSLKLMSVESVMLSNYLIRCSSLLLLSSLFPSIRWPKYWRFSFSINPSNGYSGLISFRIDWFDLAVQQTLQESSPVPQFQSINFLALSLLYGSTHICARLLEICSMAKCIFHPFPPKQGRMSTKDVKYWGFVMAK